jgi:hypothetical protein
MTETNTQTSGPQDITEAVDALLASNFTSGLNSLGMIDIVFDLAEAAGLDIIAFLQEYGLDDSGDRDANGQIIFDELPEDSERETVDEWLCCKWDLVVQLLVDKSTCYTLEGPHDSWGEYEIVRLPGKEPRPDEA